MLHPGTRCDCSRIAGIGIIATTPIKVGTVVWHPCYSCQVLGVTELEERSREERLEAEEFGYTRVDGSILIPCNGAHLLNHSCDPNVLDYGLEFGIAVRDIDEGAEITCDYRTFISDPVWGFICNCRSGECVGWVRSRKEIEPQVAWQWGKRVTSALDLIHTVVQPLDQSLRESSKQYREMAELFRSPPSSIRHWNLG